MFSNLNESFTFNHNLFHVKECAHPKQRDEKWFWMFSNERKKVFFNSQTAMSVPHPVIHILFLSLEQLQNFSVIQLAEYFINDQNPQPIEPIIFSQEDWKYNAADP